MKVGYTSHVADGGQSFLRRLFLERVSKVPEVISSLEPGRSLTLHTGLWDFLKEWSRRFNLDANWIRQRAHELILTWPTSGEAYLTCTDALQAIVPPELPTYYPTLVTREDYLKQAEAVAITYCDESEKLFSAAGHKDDVARDIDWTVRFQVKREKQSDIAKSIALTGEDVYNAREPAKTVAAAVRRTLRIIELKSRGR